MLELDLLEKKVYKLLSDYSILEFNSLDTLLLYWGRLDYKNTSQMSNFIIHRRLIINLIQIFFHVCFIIIQLLYIMDF